LKEHGIDPEVWAERGVWRYDGSHLDELRDAFRPWKRNVGIITRLVKQSGGLLMPKHPPTGLGTIPPQLRPDWPVITNPRKAWHYHGDAEEQWPVFPPGAPGDGKALPKRLILGTASRETHLAKSSGDPYAPETGLGVRKGVNIEAVHFHAPEVAKYVLLGDSGANRRIDLHPRAARLVPNADRVFFVLEGTLKNDAVVSAGEAVFSVPSVTLWDSSELRLFAQAYLQGKTVFVIPDADWFTNREVDKQALFVRTLLRWEGINAYIAAPPVSGLSDGVKGVDDFLGGGGAVEELVIRGREAEAQRLYASVNASFYGLHGKQRRRAWRALDGLALHADLEGRLCVPTNALVKMMGTYKRAIVPTLEDLARASVIEVDGSLEMRLNERFGFYDWAQGRPTIIVKPEFRAVEGAEQLLGGTSAR